MGRMADEVRNLHGLMMFADDAAICSENRDQAEEALPISIHVCANERDSSERVKLPGEGGGFPVHRVGSQEQQRLWKGSKRLCAHRLDLVEKELV